MIVLAPLLVKGAGVVHVISAIPEVKKVKTFALAHPYLTALLLIPALATAAVSLTKAIRGGDKS